MAVDESGRGQEQARILLVEDEERIARFLAKGLRGEGHEVVVAEDGDVGAYLATTELFDAVVLDLGLPGASGLDVLVAVRDRHPRVPIIMLTGHDDASARRTCLEAGASDFVTKPLVFAELRDTVRAHLDGPDTS